MKELNEQQNKAVLSSKKSILVKSVPGSGKTEVLTRRIIDILDTNPTSIVYAITFTRRAAAEMRSRLGDRQCWIGTFHSLALDVIKSAKQSISWPVMAIIKDRSDAMAIASSIGIEDPSSFSHDLDKYAIDGKSRNEEFDANLKLYINKCREDRIMDLRLAIPVATHCLSSGYRFKVNHLLIDEAQDINSIQASFSNALSPDNVFVVGDPDQCIYEWRGSNPKLLSVFKPEEEIPLPKSYRLSKQVASAAVSLIEKNDNRRGFNIECVGHEGVVSAHSYTSQSKEMLAIIDAVKKGDISYCDTSVICRSNFQVDNIVNGMKSRGIPVGCLADVEAFWNSFEVRAVMNILKFYESRSISVLKLVTSALSTPELGGALKAISSKSSVDSFFRRLRMKSAGILEVLEAVKYEFPLARLFRPESETALCDFMGYIGKWIHTQKKLYGRDLIDEVSDFLKWESEHDPIDDLAGEQCVTVLTAHSAKGLEWNNVIIAGAFEGMFPHGKAKVEEERRLMFVSVTRARNSAFITCPLSYKDKPVKPSRFIKEMGLKIKRGGLKL